MVGPSGVGAAPRPGGAVGRGAGGVRGGGETGRSARRSYHLLVRRAALELKAGDLGLANRLLDRAQNELGEAAPVWLLMTIESRRYALLPVMADEFEHRWLTALKKSRRSAAIGEMCRIMAAHLLMNVDYAGRDDHVARLLDFLRGCRRIRKWQAGDLRARWIS